MTSAASTYVIGDIHGCHQTLLDLLEEIEYDPAHDRIWLVGDLVNNGPRSAEVVRWAMAQRQLACVLGNHDLHLLAVAYGAKKRRKKDTFGDILEAPDRQELLAWVRTRPLFYQQGKDAMVHAGLLARWSMQDAAQHAREVERALQQDDVKSFLEQMYGNQPDRWCAELEESARMRLTINAMTRMRAVDEQGRLDFSYKSTLQQLPAELSPWFVHMQLSEGSRLFFGHWSAIGPHHHKGIHALDAGATWGRALMAYRLEDSATFAVPTAAGEAA